MSVTSFLESRQRTCNPHGVCEGRSEAAASGSVLVTTDVPGCCEVVTREDDRIVIRKTLAVYDELIPQPAATR